MPRAWAPAAMIASLLSVGPGVAQAHLVTSGLGPFYDGALHLLLSPGDLLGVLALALLAGLRGPAAGRLAVMALPSAWLLAGMVGLAVPTVLEPSWPGALSYLLVGVLLAANLPLPPWVIGALAAGYGALHGLLNGSALAAIGAGWPELLGIVTTVLMLTLLISAAVVPLRAEWGQIILRVIGSWVAAIGLLMLGWTLQGAA
jgi:hydrogenase/urease accessory protein HupE